MKIFTGLFMAWGNFLTVPCPCKKWDDDLKNYMLGFLPTIGLILGGLWAGICLLMVWLGVPFLVMAFLLTFLLFAFCGYMHLDGFMDCCDAIMSRKPLEKRQEILKDSHCGAFSIVSVCFMILGYYACISTALSGGMDFVDLILIPVVSRGVAGIHVLCCKPIGHSQYSQGAGADNKAQKKKAVLLTVLQLLLFCGGGLFLATNLVPTLVIVGVTALGAVGSIFYGRKNLGGMSGDIAGFGIVWAEFIGIFGMLVL